MKPRTELRRAKLPPILEIDEDGIAVSEHEAWGHPRWSADEKLILYDSNCSGVFQVYAYRLAERGYNQSALLARRVARALGLPVDAQLLQRVFETPHLADLPPPERARAIRGAFALAPGARRRVEGRSLALVDDVMTTGATAAEAARTLLAAGAAGVDLWVVARTPPPMDR